MKEKIKKILKDNIYSVVVIASILGAVFTFIIKEADEMPFLLFSLVALFFLAIIWFFSRDKQIKEFTKDFNERFPFLGKTLAVIFRITTFLIFLFSICIIIVGIIDTFEQIKDERISVELRKKYALSEAAYQKCLDKVAALTTYESVYDRFLGETIKWTKEINKYFGEWVEDGRPNYNPNRGRWEWAFMKWMIEKYPEFCGEYDINLINYFLTIKTLPPLPGIK